MLAHGDNWVFLGPWWWPLIMCGILLLFAWLIHFFNTGDEPVHDDEDDE